MNTQKTYQLEVTEEELKLIHDVFKELTEENFHKWFTMIPNQGERRSEECFQQWLTTDKYNSVRHKANILLEGTVE